MTPHVSLEMRSLGIELATALVVTLVDLVFILDVSLGRCISPWDASPMGKIVLVVDVYLPLLGICPLSRLLGIICGT